MRRIDSILFWTIDFDLFTSISNISNWNFCFSIKVQMMIEKKENDQNKGPHVMKNNRNQVDEHLQTGR